MIPITLSTICFANEMAPAEIPLFRGAVINSLKEDEVLFHNHIDNNFRYAYPLIQYKLLRRKASIVCLNKGAEAIKMYLDNFASEIMLGKKPEKLILDSCLKTEFAAGIDCKEHRYLLRHWLPLNKQNFEQWICTESVSDKSRILERILTGNILSFGKGVGIIFEDEVKCTLTGIFRQYQSFYKGVRLTSFDISFSANVAMPENIGLGKGASIGNGILSHII